MPILINAQIQKSGKTKIRTHKIKLNNLAKKAVNLSNKNIRQNVVEQVQSKTKNSIVKI